MTPATANHKVRMRIDQDRDLVAGVVAVVAGHVDVGDELVADRRAEQDRDVGLRVLRPGRGHAGDGRGLGDAR
jgi:hypothetical protein